MPTKPYRPSFSHVLLLLAAATAIAIVSFAAGASVSRGILIEACTHHGGFITASQSFYCSPLYQPDAMQ